MLHRLTAFLTCVWLPSNLKSSLNFKIAASRGQRMLKLIKIAFKYLQPTVQAL